MGAATIKKRLAEIGISLLAVWWTAKHAMPVRNVQEFFGLLVICALVVFLVVGAIEWQS
jgi:hypothetical protein